MTSDTQRCISCAVVLTVAVCILSVIFIPITITFSTIRSDCAYYTKLGCIGSCGCNWCNTINMCTSDAGRCAGLNITSAESCGNDYTGAYIVGSIIGVIALFGLVSWVIAGAMVYENKRYIVVGGSVPRAPTNMETNTTQMEPIDTEKQL